ncbi:hypothetical protein [Actinoplanes sp. TFC3]|uniref:hypothetical protein n=1 Tax=Actinoplanes sp. TFC3 TaxID=1710355 RepID=UPI000833BE19|nr:hypothetical protein [Actinoplanes sp. TFC3]
MFQLIPEEDRAPAWLSDYGAIEADISAMEDFAKALTSEVADGYDPHVTQVAQVMKDDLPTGFPRFVEMGHFLSRHNEVKNETLANTYNFGIGTSNAAAAAAKISDDYKASDAFAYATVNDVKDAFAESAPVPAERGENG